MSNNFTYLVHGIKTSDKGSDTVMQAAPHIHEQTSVFNHAYGFVGPVCAMIRNRSIAKALKVAVDLALGPQAHALGSAYAIGHSNGCAIIVNALRQGADFSAVVLVNPALKVDTVFPPGDYRVLVIHTEHDMATRAARLLDGLPVIGWFIPDAWGAMGALGYKGTDPRVENLDLTTFVDSHSDVWSEEDMAKVGPVMADFLYGEQ